MEVSFGDKTLLDLVEVTLILHQQECRIKAMPSSDMKLSTISSEKNGLILETHNWTAHCTWSFSSCFQQNNPTGNCEQQRNWVSFSYCGSCTVSWRITGLVCLSRMEKMDEGRNPQWMHGTWKRRRLCIALIGSEHMLIAVAQKHFPEKHSSTNLPFQRSANVAPYTTTCT
jgi:hypothetical protein